MNKSYKKSNQNKTKKHTKTSDNCNKEHDTEYFIMFGLKSFELIIYLASIFRLPVKCFR